MIRSLLPFFPKDITEIVIDYIFGTRDYYKKKFNKVLEHLICKTALISWTRYYQSLKK